VEAILIDDETIAASLSKWDVTIALVSFNGRTVELEKLRSGEFRDHSSVDSVLALQTSGTTGEPKSVELSEENLRHSVESIIRSLDLGPGDVCLNLLPMVHVGGLVDLLMAPLAAEGQVIFANASEPDRVLELIRQDSISWLQGSPAILSNFVRSNQAVSSEKLRFIRSVSAPLEKSLHQRLEEFFGVPLIEIYGMSETAGVITSNPLPPGERRIGSVGVPVRCEIDI
jgi:acyl-CoA synthetase (AMP-forming)/AMP-acid ligase II